VACQVKRSAALGDLTLAKRTAVGVGFVVPLRQVAAVLVLNARRYVKLSCQRDPKNHCNAKSVRRRLDYGKFQIVDYQPASPTIE
jgi:hypothetical protein